MKDIYERLDDIDNQLAILMDIHAVIAEVRYVLVDTINILKVEASNKVLSALERLEKYDQDIDDILNKSINKQLCSNKID